MALVLTSKSKPHCMLNIWAGYVYISSLKFYKYFILNTKGNVAAIFALTIVPMLLSISLAIDFSRSSSKKVRLDAALDSAVLYVASKASKSGTISNISELTKEAELYFQNQIKSISEISVEPVALKITQSSSGTRAVKAEAHYKASLASWIKNPVSGQDVRINLSGYSASEIALPSYIDFYLLLDNSPSMGLAASPEDIDKLRTLTPESCEFACHTVYSDGSFDPNDNLAIARRNNVTLRIDLLAQATSALVSNAKSTQSKSGLENQFKVGIYGFNQDVSVLSGSDHKLYIFDNGLLSDLVMAGTKAASLTLTPYSADGNFHLTDFTSAFSAMNSIVSSPGDGSKAETPQKYLFFVTDGVQDMRQGSSSLTDPKYTQYDFWGHTLAPIDPQMCFSLKSRGIKVAVLYTTYYATAPGDSPLYDQNIAYWADDISAKLQDCASPGLFYTASSTGIKDAMLKMFQDAVKNARLTD